MDRVMFSSQSVEWGTPQALFDDLSREFGGFDLDPCATPENAKCERFYTLDTDWNALALPWEGKVFMNPPYGHQATGRWVRKAWEAAQAGATVVCLIPSRTDTRWWHDYCMKGEIRFIRGRLRFNGAAHGAPFPSAIVIFRPPVKHNMEKRS